MAHDRVVFLYIRESPNARFSLSAWKTSEAYLVGKKDTRVNKAAAVMQYTQLAARGEQFP